MLQINIFLKKLNYSLMQTTRPIKLLTEISSIAPLPNDATFSSSNERVNITLYTSKVDMLQHLRGMDRGIKDFKLILIML